MQLLITKRTGEVVEFDAARIRNAIMKAVRASKQELEEEAIEDIVSEVRKEVEERFTDFYPNVENIQDIVEKYLVRKGMYEVAKSYILYRAEHQKKREDEKSKNLEKLHLGRLTVKKRDGRTVIFDSNKIKDTLSRVMKGHEDDISVGLITKEVIKNIYDGISTDEIERSLILASISYIERDPAYSYLSARLFLQKLYKEVIGRSISEDILDVYYREAFISNIKKGVEKGYLDEGMLGFDLVKLSQALNIENDHLFQYMGIQTLYERYFIQDDKTRMELPQAFWMRVAMGLSLREEDKTQRAIEFYTLLSSLRFVSSTPTLFHSGTVHPQLSSCYLTTVEDDLKHIFKCLGDNAQLSKWSGGLGNDWTNIRATGAWISATKVESQGVVPFLKIANDVTMAINRSGKRRGATCAYLETWHLDVEDFLDLRKNTGDDRRRTHDMNTANWIPDLFMKRVLNDEPWTLFSPDETPDLHHIYGSAFEKKYLEYEEKARKGQVRRHKVVSATKLWRKMLSMLFETGHPWITFKDPCNVRSPQDHVGVVHSSNLCTEITLNTSKEETAVCNLGSINLARHMTEGRVNEDLLASSVKTAIHMLDNVIDINYYPTIEAKNSNMLHRPIGLGVMGIQDVFYLANLPFDSQAAVQVSDRIQEIVAYNAVLASSELAKERGTYESYKGSKWDRDIFPQDTVGLLEQERGIDIAVPKEESLDWSTVREHVKKHGMRNSNTMAIAPTATISNIAGCCPTIEPIYKNIYVKANISGEFTVVNAYLIQELKKAKQWNQETLEQLKYYDGSVQLVAGLSDEIKQVYKEAFEIDPEWLIKHAACRGRWIDQSQSLNIFMKGTSGKKIHDTYLYAWKMGLKTTYYMRSLAASQIEKSTLDAAKYGFTQKREYAQTNGHTNGAAPNGKTNGVAANGRKPTVIDGGETCEACQ